MSSRPLSPTEIDICRGIFGDAIRYDEVRIFNRKWWIFQPRRVTMAPDGNIWFHPDSSLFRDSFCGASPRVQALFIHEMAHVWQHQQGVFLPLARHPFCRYDYQLEPGKAFADYGIEQQAEIVSHVFLLKQGLRLSNGYTLQNFEGLLPFGQQPLN